MSHFHEESDGFPNLEELADANPSEDHGSNYSYPRPQSVRDQVLLVNQQIDGKVWHSLEEGGNVAYCC